MENEQIEDTQNEDIQTSTEDVNNEEKESQEETKDWKAEALKYKAIADRKDKKLQEKKPLKTNQETSVMTDERVALLTQDPNVAKLKFADDYAKVKGITLTEAYNSSVAQAEFREMDNQSSIKANSLGASTGTAPAPRAKTVVNMTEDEHRDLWNEKSKGAING